MPRLAGQDLGYALKLLRQGADGADVDGLMTMAAQPLTETDIDNLAHYIADLPAAPPR